MQNEQLKSMDDLFIHELRDIYSAEKQLIEALPKVMQAASNDKLKKAIQQHLQETQNQKERLDKIARMMEEDLSGVDCEAMKGLIKEGEEIINAEAAPAVKDAALIAAAQRIEHYEISAYGTAVNHAELLDETEVCDILEDTLKEEKEADAKLNRLAIQTVNKQAEAVS